MGIVVRTKNRSWFLRRALDDIAAQGYQDWHICIVNDGGEPRAVDAAVEGAFGLLRGRVQVIHNAASQGRSAAANQGVKAIGTEFVVLHDDDDLWHSRFLEQTTSWLDQHPDDVGVAVRTEIVYEASDGSGGFAEVDRAPFWQGMTEVSYADLLVVNRVVPIGYLYRRTLHDQVGFYREDVHAAEDWEFNLRAAVRYSIGFIADLPLAYWMQRIGVAGELGNSMFTLEGEHRRYDKMIRDEALRRFAAEYGPGLPLHIEHLVRDVMPEIVRDAVREVVREEIARELDSRPTNLQRIARRLDRRR